MKPGITAFFLTVAIGTISQAMTHSITDARFWLYMAFGAVANPVVVNGIHRHKHTIDEVRPR